MSTTYPEPAPHRCPTPRWRTRDIVVAAVIGVAFGVVFWVWGLIWNGPLAVLGGLALPVQDLGYAVWLMPAVLAPLIVRKPGAALFAEMVAAGLSALLGSAWGVDTLLSASSRVRPPSSSSPSPCTGAGRSRSSRSPRLAHRPRQRGSTTGSCTTRRSTPCTSWSGACSWPSRRSSSSPAARSLLHRALKQAGVLEGFPD